jgi:hypothetical protein
MNILPMTTPLFSGHFHVMKTVPPAAALPADVGRTARWWIKTCCKPESSLERVSEPCSSRLARLTRRCDAKIYGSFHET